jgi:hypothetical protein
MEATITTEETKKSLANPMIFILMLLIVLLTAHTVYQVKRKGKTIGGSLKADAKLLASPTVIIALVGFVTALMEFIIVDNVNQHGFPDSFTKGKIFNMPDKKKLISTASTLAIASVITGFLTSLALKMMPSESKEASYYDKFMG